LAGLLAAPLSDSGGSRDSDAASRAGRPEGTLVFVFRSSRLAIDVVTGRRTVRQVPALASCGGTDSARRRPRLRPVLDRRPSVGHLAVLTTHMVGKAER
jgi:hypothetical protein